MSFETSPGANNQFEGVSHAQLAKTFYESRGTDEETGIELSLRLIEHAGLPREAGAMAVYGKDGNPVEDEGVPLALDGYVNYAAKHHLTALPVILGFLDTKPGEHGYEAGKRVMHDRLRRTA